MTASSALGRSPWPWIRASSPIWSSGGLSRDGSFCGKKGDRQFAIGALRCLDETSATSAFLKEDGR